MGKFPNTLKKQLLYVRNQLAEKNILKFDELENKLQLGVVEKKNILVGMVAAYDFNYFNRTCNVAVITDLRKKYK